MDDNKPLITIITATYNKFDHLDRTVRSVLSQSYSNIQYIITDDGSADFPSERIKGIIDDWNINGYEVKIIHHRENVGTVKNLNCAYRTGKGQYFINLSCGDVFFTGNTVDLIVREFLQSKCDVLVTSRILYRDEFIPICLLPHYDEREIISRWTTSIEQYKAHILCHSYDMASGSAMSFSKKIIVEMGYFDEKYKLWEDGPFLAKYLQKDTLHFAYNIISIWYESGGISAHTKRTVRKNPLDLDTELFNSTERLERLEVFDKGEQNLIRYMNLLFKYRGSILQKLIMVTHPIEYVSSYNYLKQRERLARSDGNEISKLLRKYKMME